MNLEINYSECKNINFYVKNGNPSIGINSCPSGVDYASQSILWGIRNGSPNTSLTKRGHAKVKTYRNIVGKDKNGNVVVDESDYDVIGMIVAK